LGIASSAQAVKVLDMHNPGEKHWDAHWGTEPLKSNGATVDHIVSEDEGGDTTHSITWLPVA
jgi:hypothetical protein